VGTDVWTAGVVAAGGGAVSWGGYFGVNTVGLPSGYLTTVLMAGARKLSATR
jgi:hypothetical protein